MTAIRAIATGNWSAGGTWNGGVPPGVGDSGFANGFTVTIDQTITCTSINTTAGGGGVAGGTFTATAARTINANVVAGSTICLTCTHGSGTTTINGNVTGSATTASAHGVQHNNAGTVTINGNVTGGTQSTARGYDGVTAPGPLNITGNVTGGTGSSAHGVFSAVAQTIVVVGSITGGAGATGGIGVAVTPATGSFTQSGGNILGATNAGVSLLGTVSITGNVTGGAAGAGALFSGASLAAVITGNVAGGSGGSTGPGVTSTHSTGTLTVNGTVTGNTAYGLSHGAAGTVTINGNVSGGTGATSNYGVGNTSGGTVNIVGDVVSGTVGYGVTGTGASGTVNITGNVTCIATASSSHGVNLTGNHNCTVTGNVTGCSVAGTSSAHGVSSSSTGTVTVTGTATGGAGNGCQGLAITAIGTYRVGLAKGNDYPNGGLVNGNNGVNLANITITCTVDALEFGSGGQNPLGVFGKWFIRAAGTNYVNMRESNAGAVVSMGELSADYPAVGDVRSGTSYNFGASVGTLIVPSPASVALNVPTDHTVGSAQLTGLAILNTLRSETFVANSIGARLKDCATVDSVGAQIEAIGP